MLNDFLIVTNQVFVLFLIILTGFALTKSGLITELGAKQMTNVLLTVVTPMVTINAFASTPFDRSRFTGLCIAAASAVATHLLGIFIGWLLFRKHPADISPVYRHAVMYSNAGFMAIPLINAVVGTEGLFYGSVYVVVFNIFLWTHGVMVMTCGEGKISLKRVFVNPGMIGAALSLILFFFSISLPAPIHEAVKMIASLNSPLAMIIIGSFMARTDLRTIFLGKQVYLVAAMRLLAIPLIIIFLLRQFDLPDSLLKACVISACAPTAANTALFSARFEKDSILASKLVAFSTLCAILTMPVLVSIAR